MSIVNQLFTLMRGGAREAAEAVIDANALRLLEQQVHECESAIRQSKRELTQVVAEKIVMEREIRGLERGIAEREEQTRQALDRGAEDLALELAGSIGLDRQALAREQAALKKLKYYDTEVRRALREAITQVKGYRREMGLLKASQQAQRASVRLNTNTDSLGNQLCGIQETTERIRRSQQSVADYLQAQRQVDQSLGERALDQRLADAGIVHDAYRAEEVLAGIRARRDSDKSG